MSDPVHVACPACLAKNRVPAERLSADPSCGRCKHALFDAHPLTLTEASFDPVVSRTDLPIALVSPVCFSKARLISRKR